MMHFILIQNSLLRHPKVVICFLNNTILQPFLLRMIASHVSTKSFYLLAIVISYFVEFSGSAQKLMIRLPHLPVYELTFYSLKVGPKNRPWLIRGSKTKIKRSSGQFFLCVTIAYLKENSKIKEKFFMKIHTQK